MGEATFFVCAGFFQWVMCAKGRDGDALRNILR